MTELQGHEDRLEIGADSGVLVRSRTEGLHGRSRVGGSAPSLCQRAGCHQSRPWDLDLFDHELEPIELPADLGLQALRKGATITRDQLLKPFPAVSVQGVVVADPLGE